MHKLGMWMTYLAWILLLAIMTMGFDKFLQKQENPNQEPAITSTPAYAEISLVQNRSGHYVADGEINGHPVTFMLDTGATWVAVPQSLADSLRLEKDFRMDMDTANGTVPAYGTVLQSVSLGPITLQQVKAIIAPNMSDDTVLLGMNFMRNLQITQQDKRLTLRETRR